MILFPAIDLHNGCCVRLLHGLLENSKVYSQSPLETAQDFVSQGCRWIHLVDLDGAMDLHHNNRERISEVLSQVEVPVQVGGGIRSAADVTFYLKAGAARVILGSMALEQPDLLQSLVETWGDQIVVGVDVKDGRIATRGWTRQAEIDLQELLDRLYRQGVKRIIYTDIGRDGTLKGPALESTLQLAQSTSMQVIASGGVSCLQDLLDYKRFGQGRIEGVVVGKAIYEGCFTVEQALRVLKESDTLDS